MSESKVPAICCVCETTGPQRKEALGNGWQRAPSVKSRWYCPDHVETLKKDFAPSKLNSSNRALTALSFGMGMGMRYGNVITDKPTKKTFPVRRGKRF